MKQIIGLIWLVIDQAIAIRSPARQRFRGGGPDADIPAA
jgi:hypothetical protein